MSRIHEALKKAELEAGAAAVADLRPLKPQTSAASLQEELIPLVENKAGIALPPPVDFPKSTTALRLEEISKACMQVDWEPDPSTDVFANGGSNLEAAEQFLTLRSRLYNLRAESALRSVLITSPFPGDGKTFVASNLARAIVRQSERRVLLIDADLRCSNLHLLLGALAEPGLGDYLSSAAGEMAVMQHGREGGLYFIASGRPTGNPSELLSNGRLKTLIERAAPCFDWIIIDSPPCLPVADASLMAGLCDVTLLIVRAGATPSSATHKAHHDLQKTNRVGIVLNAVDEKTVTYGSHYGRDYYGHLASEDSTQ
jgi:protein-tyrosine kinase